MWGLYLYYGFSVIALLWLIVFGSQIASEDANGNITIKTMRLQELCWLVIGPSLALYGIAWLFRVFL